MNSSDVKPRGFYLSKAHLKWSKDTTTEHYEGPWMKFYYPLIKLSILSVVGFLTLKITSSSLLAICFCILLTLIYPYWISSVVPNTIVMPALDM